MGAMLKILSLIDGKKRENIVNIEDIDTVECAFHKNGNDVKEHGLKGRVMIDTRSSNRISLDTGVKGTILFIIINPAFRKPHTILAFQGINGISVIRTAHQMYFDNEEKFSQYVLGKGGYVPSQTNDDTDIKSEES